MGVPEALDYFGISCERWICICIGWLIAAPLACLKNLTALRYTALAAIIIVMWTASLICLFYFRLGGDLDPCPGYFGQLPCPAEQTVSTVDPFGDDILALARGLPVFIFGFTCQQNICTICNEVSNLSDGRLNGIIVSSYIFSGAAFAVVALLGYLTYGSGVAQDVLKGGYPSNALVSATRLIFALLVTFSYPLQMHPSRCSCLALWRLASSSGLSLSQSEWSDEQQRVEERRYLAVTVLLILGSLAVALPVKDLGIVLGVIGATGSTTISYILPGLVYVATFRNWHVKRALAFGQLGLGLVIMPTCLIVLFI